jgi:hypothetical protein
VFFVFTAVLAEDIVVCVGCVDTFGLVVLTIWIPVVKDTGSRD